MSNRTLPFLILVGVCLVMGCDSGSGSWVAEDTAAPDVGPEDGEDTVPEVVAPGKVCCEHADGLEVLSHEDCVALEGVGHDGSACREICCQVDAQTYSLLKALQCTETAGTAHQDLQLCEEICCEIGGNAGSMARGLCVDVLRGQVIGEPEACEMICCALPGGQFESVLAFICEEEGGTPEADVALCD